MRVISRVRPKELKVKCTGHGNGAGGCGSFLGVSRADVYHTRGSSYDGSGEDYATICCPVCFICTDLSRPPSSWEVFDLPVKTPKKIIAETKKAQADSSSSA